jgi:8-oxo-dGTP pyrophosphatase MutT (NUDIX family)
MLKIYINEVPLILCNAEQAQQFQSDKTNMKGRFLNIKTLHSYIDMMEKPHTFEQVVLWSEDYSLLKKEFKKLFKIIRAAGGLVRNTDGRILFIFRRDFWDLPKGKIEKNEKKKEAAIREVQEETGIQQIDLQDFICKTYHVYTFKEKRVLKKSYWYNMTTTDTTLTPQTEEDIEQAVWLSKEEFFAEKRIVYKNILEVLKAS